MGLCLHFVRPAFEGRTQTDLHLLRHLILLHLLDHRDLSPHAPGDLGNLNDDFHLKNLHDFFFCSTDVQPIFVCTYGSSEPVSGYWICSFGTTATSTILSVNFTVFCASCVVGTCIKISRIPVKEYDSSSGIDEYFVAHIRYCSVDDGLIDRNDRSEKQIDVSIDTAEVY